MTQVTPEADAGGPPAAPTIDPNEHTAVVLENALLRAGVDLETDGGKLVRDAWTGRTPDPEAIKAHWDLVKPPPLAEVPLPPQEQRIEGEGSQAAERGALSATSVVEPNPTDEDPREKALRAGIETLAPSTPGARAGTRDDAMAVGLHTLLEAAGSGDSRVLVTSETPTF